MVCIDDDRYAHRYSGDYGEWLVRLGGLDGGMRGRLQSARHLILVGCGTSYYAALFGSHVFRELCFHSLQTVQVFDAAEFTKRDLGALRFSEVVIIVVSQSGETKDCQRVLELVRDQEIVSVGVVNVVGSWIPRHTSCGVFLNAGREVGVASTKSFTSQCLVLSLIALWFSGDTSKSWSWGPRLFNFPDQFRQVMPAMNAAALRLVPVVRGAASTFILGRGFSHAISLEGALKLKELTYQNVEGFPGGSLKHGPFAVISHGTPVFLSCWDGPNLNSMLSAAEQVQSRGAKVILLHNRRGDADLGARFPDADLVFVDMDDEWSAALASVLLFQYLAVYVARANGNDPDCPRHLAKVVTVDG